MKGGDNSAGAIISKILPASVELACVPNDSVLPSYFRLTPLVMVALMESVEGDIVNTVRLRESLERIAKDPDLAVYDQIKILTVSTTA